MHFDGADAKRPILGTDVTGNASRELNPGQLLVGALVGVKRSDGRVTVARLEPPRPSTSPGFFHVTLDSSGSYKDVPMDQLYSFCLDAYDLLTENDGARAQVAPVRNAVRCIEPLTALFLLFLVFAGWVSVLYVISMFLSLQIIGRIPPVALPIAEPQGVLTQNKLIIT